LFKKKAAIAFDLLSGRNCDSCYFYFYENPFESIARQVEELDSKLPKNEYLEKLKRVKFLQYCYLKKKEEKSYRLCKFWKEKQQKELGDEQ